MKSCALRLLAPLRWLLPLVSLVNTPVLGDVFVIHSFGQPYQDSNGAWLYRYDAEWSLPTGFSHWDMILDHPNLAELFISATPNGSVYMEGDPTIEGNEGSLVMWDYGFPELSGHTEGGFFTLAISAPPREGDHFDDAVLVKYGDQSLYGHLHGFMPDLEIPEPVLLPLALLLALLRSSRFRHHS